MHDIKICHLYPELLNMYGDRGNIMALKKRAQWRNINVQVLTISLGDYFSPLDYDLVFMGGGQDYEQEIIQNDILDIKGDNIIKAIEDNKVFLCICGGYQLLGKYYKTWDEKQIEFLGALDLWTIGSEKRMIGNMIMECDFLPGENSGKQVVGFENHSGCTYLGPSVKPLGKVIKGYGNNGEDGYEGAIYKNVYCSYSHGSLLPKNPALTDHLLSLALKQKYGDFEGLDPLDDSIEYKAHDSVIKRVLRE